MHPEVDPALHAELVAAARGYNASQERLHSAVRRDVPPRPLRTSAGPTTARWYTPILVGAVVLASLVLGLAACDRATTHQPDPVACEAAMVEQLRAATADPAGEPGTRPAACEGIPDDQLKALAGRALLRVMGGDPDGVDAPVTLDAP